MRRCPLTAASQLGDERRALFRPPFLGPSPCEASSAVPKEGCLVVQGVPGDVVASGQHQTTNILNRLYAGLRLRLPVTSSTCRFHPFPIATGLGRVGGIELRGCVHQACAMELYGGVQCAQYWPHPLHLWFICHGLVSWDGDSEVLRS